MRTGIQMNIQIRQNRGIFVRIIICDDDTVFIKQLREYLQEYFQRVNKSCPQIAEFHDGETLLEDDGKKDIVFLDIEMKGIDGICVGNELKKRSPDSIIFVITSFAEYLDEAMRFHVFRYLSKPLDKQRLFRNLRDAVHMYMVSVITVPVETKEKMYTVHASDIIFVEAQGRNVTVHTVHEDYVSIHNMQHWRNTLQEKCFYHTHRSFIVNMAFVNDFDHTLIHLYHNQFRAYLTRRKYSSFKEAYLLYLESVGK